jgi:gliding motility-associated-like protein
VYNRYGQLVYRSTGYNTPWDGRYNGTPLPFGTYYWIINPKNGRAAITGSVTIIR